MLLTTEIETLDPRIATDANSIRATRLIHAGLFRLDNHLRPIPYVAKDFSWESHRAFRVRLRRDVSFSDGRPVGVADVVASIQSYQRDSSRHKRVVASIETVEIRNQEEVVFHLREDHATLLSDLEVPILLEEEAKLPPQSSRVLRGLGPYEVASFTHGTLRLLPRKGSAYETPTFPIVMRTVREENARALRLKANEADIGLNVFSPPLLGPLRSAGLSVASFDASNLTYALVNHEHGALRQVAVREAISLAIDRALITSTLFDGIATPAQSLIPKAHWSHRFEAPLPFDIARARELLLSLGYRIDGSDDRLHLTLSVSTDRFRTSVARFIAQEMRSAGIVLDVVPLELGTLLSRLGKGDFQLAILQMPEITEANTLKTFLHSAMTPPLGNNRGRVTNPELDSLFDDAEKELDPERRTQIYARMEDCAHATLPIIPLWHERNVAVTSERARAFVPSPEGRWLGLADLR